MNTIHMNSNRMNDGVVDVTRPATSFPAYYLGRPVAMYQRRYRRRITASGRLV